MNQRHAFTLIELLVVIAIIAIVAALVVNMNAGAQAAKKATQVNADKFKLVLMIDNYQSKLNFYPPDNGSLASLPVTSSQNFAYYDAAAATNPLIYELTGGTNNYPTNGYIQLFDTNVAALQTTYSNLFGRASVQNGNPDEPHDFFRPGPQAKECAYYSGYTLNGLLVPVPLLPNMTNYWHYDSSSTNRHNLNGCDLWAEYLVGNKNGYNVILTNGNW
jgi:prepilin-type N-terminal cleavage/methylation domain-containing protein